MINGVMVDFSHSKRLYWALLEQLRFLYDQCDISNVAHCQAF
jgi:hypothetical protein